jgi:DNA transformation protein
VKGIRHDDFVEHVCDLLAPLGAVRARAMFGGYGIYVDDVFCAIVAYDTLYLKVDDGNRADYEALGARPFKPFDDKPMVMSYYEVPAEVMDDRRALVEWGRKACQAAQRSGTRSRRSVSRPQRAPRSRAK